MAESVLDHLQVGAAGEEPGGVRVAQVVGAPGTSVPPASECGAPDLQPEPVAGNVAVGVHRPWPARGGLARRHGAEPGRWRRRPWRCGTGTCPALYPLMRAVPVPAPSRVGLGEPEVGEVGHARSGWRGSPAAAWAKISVIRAQACARSGMWAADFAASCVLSLRRRYSLSLGYSLTRNRPPSGGTSGQPGRPCG